MRVFEDIRVGEVRTSSARLISAEEIIAFARNFDPQWFHCDPAAAKVSKFGGLIASGSHTIALWRRLDHDVNGDVDFICGVSLDNVRFRHPLRPGDHIHTQSIVTHLSSISDRPDRGRMTVAHKVRNQTGKIILSLTAVSLVYTRAGLLKRS